MEDQECSAATVTLTADKLIIFYDEDRNIAMDLESDDDWDMVNHLLGDVNFWSQFLTSLSAALNNPGEIEKNG